MIGDNLETDIELGVQGGIDSLLVTTGVTSRERGLLSRATYIVDSLI